MRRVLGANETAKVQKQIDMTVSEPSTPGLPPTAQRPSSSARRSRDFIIKGKASTSSLAAGSQSQLQAQHQQERQLNEQRKMVAGLGNKPHQLSKQNEVIQRMLGGQGPHPTAGGMVSKPITSSREPLVASSELKDALGGTPKPPRKMGAPLTNKRGTS